LVKHQGQTEQITGPGGTFPAPVYARWADTARSAIGIDVTCNAIGSGAGQDQTISRGVDFGASDAPMDDAASVPPNCCSSPRSSALWW
jgi:phosphate transport system substrate-binding protein